MSGGRGGNTVAMMFSSYYLLQTLVPLALSFSDLSDGIGQLQMRPLSRPRGERIFVG